MKMKAIENHMSRKVNKKADSKRELDDVLKRKLKDEDDVPERLVETPDRNPLLRSPRRKKIIH